MKRIVARAVEQAVDSLSVVLDFEVGDRKMLVLVPCRGGVIFGVSCVVQRGRALEGHSTTKNEPKTR